MGPDNNAVDASFYAQGTNGDTVQLIKKIYRA